MRGGFKLKTALFFLLSITILFNFAFAGPVPDTGQTSCYNNTEEIPCPNEGEAFYGQDAQYDINPQSFTKLGSNGIELSEDATPEDGWIMTRDNVTGLIWEVKTDDGTIHDKDDFYSWQNSQDVFIAALNNEVFGGFSDWRLPDPKELKSIVHSQVYNPSIDQTYFQKTMPSAYWSSISYANSSGHAWYVFFRYGDVNNSYKSSNCYVRAVRGGQSSNFAYVDNRDGTVTDPDTGLMWQQGNPGQMTWEAALSYCEGLSLAGYSDWRLPNDKELQSIVDYSKYNPSIDSIAFPKTISVYYWSSTSFANGSTFSWYVGLYDGSVGLDYKYYSYYVRAVRTIIPELKGDFNRDGTIDIMDAILGMQILSSMIPASSINLETDVNGDGKIGMAEVVYVLREIVK